MAKKKVVEAVKPVEPVKKEPVVVKPPYPQPKKKGKYGWLSREA